MNSIMLRSPVESTTDFFKNSKYASSAKCACSKVCFTPALNFR